MRRESAPQTGAATDELTVLPQAVSFGAAGPKQGGG